MTRLILDHYRRWARVLMVVAVAEFGLGWLIALGPQYTYEFWTFCLALWSGAVLLSFDFQRGLLRPLAVLPVTGRQLGRSWWMATVPVPAMVLAVLMFAGAAARCHFRPGHALPLERLALGCLFGFVWLGMEFALTFNAARGFGTSAREFVVNSVMSWFTILFFFGSMLLCMDASKSATRSAILLGFGGWLTVVGWLRADRFNPGRAGLYLGRIEPPNWRREKARLEPLELKIPAARPEGFTGYGGIRFFVNTLFIRAFAALSSLTALLVLLFVLQKRLLTVAPDFQVMAIVGSFMSCWFLVFFQFMPLLRHLRVLRTLPVSPTGLAVALVAVVVLPLLALGALATAVTWLTLGTQGAHTVLNGYLFTLALGALGAFVAVWRGNGTQAYALLLLGLVLSNVAYMALQGRFSSPASFTVLDGAIAAAGVLLAFMLTRLVLVRSSQVYRVQADPFGRVLQGQSS